MNFPEPRPGLVIRYEYLWNREHRVGREEGTKARPCAIVVSVVDAGGKRRVLAVPVTHTPPEAPQDAIEIPASIKRLLGLDGERSWIVISEANRFSWPGPDLRPVPGRDPASVVYGSLPQKFFQLVRDAFLVRFTQFDVKTVPRSE